MYMLIAYIHGNNITVIQLFPNNTKLKKKKLYYNLFLIHK